MGHVCLRTFAVLPQIGQHQVGAALLIAGAQKDQRHRQVARENRVDLNVRQIVGVANKARRPAENRQKRSEIVEIADNVMGYVDFRVTRKYLNILRFVEAACTLDREQCDRLQGGKC